MIVKGENVWILVRSYGVHEWFLMKIIGNLPLYIVWVLNKNYIGRIIEYMRNHVNLNGF